MQAVLRERQCQGRGYAQNKYTLFLSYNGTMALPEISVVIPTRGRSQILRKCLEHLEHQTIRDRLEVIAVIDGEDPKTAEMLSSLRWNFPLTCFAIPKAQQGVARNRGVEQARGDIILFIGDDIFLAADACERHLRAYERCQVSGVRCQAYPPKHEMQRETPMERDDVLKAGSWKLEAVLGFTAWDPAIGITPVMLWLEKTGWQFGYGRIAKYAGKFLPPEIQHRFTYTSNISLPKNAALRLPFREDTTLYGWEDVEWGIRLRDAGIPLFFEPTAGALHHHRLALEDSLNRMEELGQAARVFAKLHPGFDRVPRGGKLLLYRCCALLPTLRGRHAKAFLKGLRKDREGL